MIHAPTADNKTILFGVTSSQSLKLLGKIPIEMAEIGWSVHVVAGDTSSEVPKDFDAIQVHTLPMKRNPSPISDVSSLIAWIRLVQKVQPKIVVIGTPKAALIGLVASFSCRVPVRVYHLRGLRLQTASGATKLLLFVLEWLTAKVSTSILAVSPSLGQEYCKLGLSDERKVEVLGLGSSHGVDIVEFNPSRWLGYQPREAILRESLKAGTPILGFVGRFSTDKGAHELLHCKKVLLESKVPHTLLVIGPIEENEEALEQLKLLCDTTVITGPVLDVAPYYSIMTLLLLPTHREGFPNAVLEAAASGVPSITTDVTGAIDSVVDGKTGILVESGDRESFALEVRKLLMRPQLIASMGREARGRVLSDFDSIIVEKNHVAYFMKCAGYTYSAK